MEYGDFLPTAAKSTGMSCALQYAISASREFSAHSRQGAITRSPGFKA